MNNYSSVASSGNAVDAANRHAFLQQAVDHYPRLAASSFTLLLPYCETQADYRALILRFHTEVWQRTGAHSRERQQERKNSPPTLLRWMWESASAPQCRMVLMMNLDTLVAGSSVQHVENTMQVMSELLREAWLTVCGAEQGVVADLTPVIINRADRGGVTTPFNPLKARVQEMSLPVMTARTGVICP